MSMLMSTVARGGTILVQAGNPGGNIPDIIQELVGRIPTENDDRKTYSEAGVCFHYLVYQKIIFLVVADESLGATKPFHFLQTLQNEWTRYYGSRSATITPDVATVDFSRKMSSLMGQNAATSFGGPSSNPSGPKDKIELVSKRVDEVRSQMVQNLDNVLARGERIEALVASTSTLDTNAATFKRTAVTLKRHMWWKNIKCWIILGVVLLIIAFVFALVICKGNFKTCGRKADVKPPTPPAPVAPPHEAPTTVPPTPTTPSQIPPNTLPPDIPTPEPETAPEAVDPPTTVPAILPVPISPPVSPPAVIIPSSPEETPEAIIVPEPNSQVPWSMPPFAWPTSVPDAPVAPVPAPVPEAIIIPEPAAPVPWSMPPFAEPTSIPVAPVAPVPTAVIIVPEPESQVPWSMPPFAGPTSIPVAPVAPVPTPVPEAIIIPEPAAPVPWSMPPFALPVSVPRAPVPVPVAVPQVLPPTSPVAPSDPWIMPPFNWPLYFPNVIHNIGAKST